MSLEVSETWVDGRGEDRDSRGDRPRVYGVETWFRGFTGRVRSEGDRGSLGSRDHLLPLPSFGII